MEKHIFAFLIPFAFGVAHASEQIVCFNVNKVCATIVGIPYASDNFTDEEWEKFQKCTRTFRQLNLFN
jgi:hypothetical protein